MATGRNMGRNALQILALFVAFFFSVAIVYTDVLYLDNTMGERSLVQLSQALMILASAGLFAESARRQIDQRGYLLLVSTLFLCMFVRENDGFLDSIVHGFWKVPVLLIACVGGVAVLKNSNTLRSPFLRHTKDSSFWIMAIGFLQLMVFSRLFGSGQLWDSVLHQDDVDAVKSIIQESTELVSYSLIFLGSYMSLQYQYGEDQGLAAKKVGNDATVPVADTTTQQTQATRVRNT